MIQQGKPNILFLMTDQHRWDALGTVNPVVKTPNLDRIASRGIHFTQAVCNAPMCVPSRYSLMTGLYPSQAGVRHNTQMCITDKELPLKPLPQRLRDAGYQTAGIGKTHWFIGSANATDVDVVTSARGFEIKCQARGLDPKTIPPGCIVMEADNPEAWGKVVEETSTYGYGGENAAGYLGRTSAIPSEEHIEGWLTGKALDFLEQQRDPDRPFFLYLSFDFPHAGFNVPAGYEDLYNIDEIVDTWPLQDEKTICHVKPWWYCDDWDKATALERRRSTLRYYALCSYVDGLFGRVLKKIEEMGELENTFVIFVSDHGEMLGERRRFSKYCMYESSIRVPMILAGKGVPEELHGTRDQRCAELVDVLPTLLQAAGEEVPQELVGASLLDQPGRMGSFSEMHGSGYQEIERGPIYMWRTCDWKLILCLPDFMPDASMRLHEVKGELYHLTEDPKELKNLYDDDAHLAVRERLTRDLLMHLACAWSRFPRHYSGTRLDRGNYSGVRSQKSGVRSQNERTG